MPALQKVEVMDEVVAKNAWVTQGGGNYFVWFYLGEGKGNLQVKMPKAAVEKLVNAKLFKVIGNVWGGKKVTLTFETPPTAQRFQEAVTMEDLVSVPKKGGGSR